MPALGTVTCPRCVRRVCAKDDVLMQHMNGRGQICERSGTQVRDVKPIRGVA